MVSERHNSLSSIIILSQEMKWKRWGKEVATNVPKKKSDMKYSEYREMWVICQNYSTNRGLQNIIRQHAARPTMWCRRTKPLMTHSPVCLWKTETLLSNFPAEPRSIFYMLVSALRVAGWSIVLATPNQVLHSGNKSCISTLLPLYFSASQSADNTWHFAWHNC